jgi:hypothetical protein
MLNGLQNQINNFFLKKKVDALPMGNVQWGANMAQMDMNNGVNPFVAADAGDKWLRDIAACNNATEDEKKLASIAHTASNMLMMKQFKVDTNNLQADNYKIAANISRTSLIALGNGIGGPIAFTLVKVGNEILKNIKDLKTQDEVATVFRNAVSENLGREKGTSFSPTNLMKVGDKWINEAENPQESTRRANETKKIVMDYSKDQNNWLGDIEHVHLFNS